MNKTFLYWLTAVVYLVLGIMIADDVKKAIVDVKSKITKMTKDYDKGGRIGQRYVKIDL